jgi:hypothetical protein
LASSPGWNDSGPIWIQMYAPKRGLRIPGMTGAQEQERREHRDVPVALQNPVIADEQDRRQRDGDRDRRPGDLPDAGGLPAVESVGDVEACDLRDPDAVEAASRSGELERSASGATTRRAMCTPITSALAGR